MTFEEYLVFLDEYSTLFTLIEREPAPAYERMLL
jgi:hypothetical protein